MAAKDRKFQLLEVAPVNFSLTEGTDIPPPPASPVQEAVPPTRGQGPLSSHPTTPRAGAFPDNALQNGSDGVSDDLDKTATNDASLSQSKQTSPVALKRPNSVRRFLGLRNPGSSDNLHADAAKNRPMSPQSVQTTMTDSSKSLTRKKSNSWFGKRKSMMIVTQVDGKGTEEKENRAVPRGPPPPTIPEFTALGTVLDGGNLDAEGLFKDIK